MKLTKCPHCASEQGLQNQPNGEQCCIDCYWQEESSRCASCGDPMNVSHNVKVGGHEGPVCQTCFDFFVVKAKELRIELDIRAAIV